MTWPFTSRSDTQKDKLVKKRERLTEREDRATASFETALRELDRAMAVVAAENDSN